MYVVQSGRSSSPIAIVTSKPLLLLKMRKIFLSEKLILAHSPIGQSNRLLHQAIRALRCLSVPSGTQRPARLYRPYLARIRRVVLLEIAFPFRRFRLIRRPLEEKPNDSPRQFYPFTPLAQQPFPSLPLPIGYSTRLTPAKHCFRNCRWADTNSMSVQ